MVTNFLGPVRQMFEGGGWGGDKGERITFSKKGRGIGALVLISTYNFQRLQNCTRHTNSGVHGQKSFNRIEFISNSSEILKF